MIAELDGRVVGYGALDPFTNEVEAVFVDPLASGRGVGRALLQAVEDLAASKGIHLRLASTPNAERFYRGAGYSAIQRQEYALPSGLKLAAILMEKNLCAAV